MTLSSRYATATLLVVLAALLPTVATSYGRRPTTGQPPLAEALPERLDGWHGSPTGRRASTIRREFDSQEWVERSYARPGESPVTLLAVRSLDMKRLYHHPELAVSSADYQRAVVHEFPAQSGPVDVHVLHGGARALAAYVLLYRDETVARPFLFQITVAPDLLLRGRRPLLLLFAEDKAAGAADSVGDAGPVRLLLAAVDAIRGGAARAGGSSTGT